MKLIKTKIGDLPFISKIAKRCIENMNIKSMKFWDEFYPTEREFKRNIVKGSLYSITEKDEIIGSICINDEMSEEYLKIKWEYKKFKVIRRLMINPSKQGFGYAKRAMMFAEKEIMETGYSSIRLAVYIKNVPATNLYQSLGYRLRGEVQFPKGPACLYEKEVIEPFG